MKHHFLNCLLGCSFLASSAAHATTVQPFHQLVVTGHIKALVTSQQAQHDVTVTGPQEQLDHIEISNHHGTLSIKDHNHYTIYQKPMVVAHIDAQKLKSIFLSVSVTCMVEKINSNTFDADVSGQSQCIIAGTSQQLKLRSSGSGHIFADHLATKQATISASGNSRSYVQASLQLNATASGASMIKYYGQPQLSCHRSGHAKVSGIKTLDKHSYEAEKRLQRTLFSTYQQARQYQTLPQ